MVYSKDLQFSIVIKVNNYNKLVSILDSLSYDCSLSNLGSDNYRLGARSIDTLDKIKSYLGFSK